MEFFNAKRITNIGVMTALYVVATLACSPLAYGQVQFRISEMLMLLCYFNKDYVISMSLGCVIVNLFSPLGFMDVAFGTMATLIAGLLIYVTRNKVNLWIASLFPVVSNGLIVGAELTYLFHANFFVNAGFVALGEFVCVSVVGVIIIGILSKNDSFMKLIMSGTNKKTV